MGQFRQVQTLRPKTQQLCRDSQLRHHTPLQLHLRLNDMSVWPRSSKKAGENQPQTRNSAMFIAVVWDLTWFQRFQFLTHLPTLTWRRGVLMMRRESSCSSDNGASNCTHSTAVKPRSKPQNGMLRHMVPHPIFPTDLGRVSVDPRFPSRGAAWLEGLQHLSTNLFHGWAWGWFKRFKHCV